MKDIFATRGVPTTWGAADFQDRIIDVEERVLARFPNWQGAGKLVLKKKGIFSSTILSSDLR